jgi:hypothetical protein
MTYDHSYEEPATPIDPKDEAYTEACEEIDRLKAEGARFRDLMTHAANAFEDKQWNCVGEKDLELIALMRKVAAK